MEIVRRVFAEFERGNFWIPEFFDPGLAVFSVPTATSLKSRDPRVAPRESCGISREKREARIGGSGPTAHSEFVLRDHRRGRSKVRAMPGWIREVLHRLRGSLWSKSEQAYKDRDEAPDDSRAEAYAAGEAHAYGEAADEVRRAEKASE